MLEELTELLRPFKEQTKRFTDNWYNFAEILPTAYKLLSILRATIRKSMPKLPTPQSLLTIGRVNHCNMSKKIKQKNKMKRRNKNNSSRILLGGHNVAPVC